ncbi:RDD family protein [Streptomyces sp. S186]|uniref:RDD family protein n=1 Tax=Streptomyces sp. S186 TaxID=3434395 RepID=UPI003F678AE6
MSGQDFPPQPYPQHNQPQPYPQYNQQPPQSYQQQPYPYQQVPPPQGQYGYQPTDPQPPTPYQYQYQSTAPQVPPPAPAPNVPEAVSTYRRFWTAMIDGILAATIVLLGFGLSGNPRQGANIGLCVAVGFSFVNHVLLTRVVGASLGKLITRTRVVLSTDGGCPRLPRLFRRWLAGYFFIAYSYITDWVRRFLRPDHLVPAMPDAPKDFCGIRLVRSDNLRSAS